MWTEPDPSRVEIGRFYPHATDVVWRAITDPTLLERWLMPSTGFVGAVEGTHFRLHRVRLQRVLQLAELRPARSVVAKCVYQFVFLKLRIAVDSELFGAVGELVDGPVLVRR